MVRLALLAMKAGCGSSDSQLGLRPETRAARRSPGSRSTGSACRSAAPGRRRRAAPGRAWWPPRRRRAAPPPGRRRRRASFSASHCGNSEPCSSAMRLIERQARDRHDPGDHGLVDPDARAGSRRGRSSARASKKNCVIAKSASRSFSAVWRRSVSTLSERGMRLRVRGDADREVAVLTDQADEIDRVRELARRQVEILRRVAAEGQDVLDPGVAVTGDDLESSVARVRGAREVRHRRHRRVAVDLDDEIVRALAGGCPGAVRDRHVRRLQRLETAERRARAPSPSRRRGAGRTRTSSSCPSAGSRGSSRSMLGDQGGEVTVEPAPLRPARDQTRRTRRTRRRARCRPT